MRTALFATLLALPLFSGCAAVAVGAIGGLVLSKEVSDNNVFETRLNIDVSKVWPMVKKTLSDASLETIEIDENVRSAKAKIDGSTVTVWVEAYDLDKTVMRTRATKYGGTINDPGRATALQERIITRLEASK
ncbi:MAG TPA: hypothetical protein VK843_23230 [Planctomycetota bacterium]|nr:hypothetical protein [Planctomycetota bacterium]